MGLVLNLALCFGMHVVFSRTTEAHMGPLRLLSPDLSSVDLAAAVPAGLAMVAMFKFTLGLPKTLAGSASLGAAGSLALALG